MSLELALLAILSEKPASGYDIKSRSFEGALKSFWPADQAQIYRTLKRLEESGALISQRKDSNTRPSRRVYSLSAAGKKELAKRRSEIFKPSDLRDPLALQLYFQDSPKNSFKKETATALLEVQIDEYEKRAREAAQLASKEASVAKRSALDLVAKTTKAQAKALKEVCRDIDRGAYQR